MEGDNGVDDEQDRHELSVFEDAERQEHKRLASCVAICRIKYSITALPYIPYSHLTVFLPIYLFDIVHLLGKVVGTTRCSRLGNVPVLQGLSELSELLMSCEVEAHLGTPNCQIKNGDQRDYLHLQSMYESYLVWEWFLQ